MKACFALAAALALGAGSASAGIVPFAEFGLQDVSDENDGTAFVRSVELSLASGAWVSGQLSTARNGNGLLFPSVDIQSAVLSGPGGPFAWTQTLATTPGLAGVETWSFGAHWLDAGVWTLQLTGVAFSDKTDEGFRGAFNVPEPESLALSVLALAGVACARRRRAA